MHTIISDEPIEVLDAPAVLQKPKRNLVLSLLPSIAMLVLIIIVRGFMSSSNGSYIIFSACMMGVGIVTSIVSFVDERRNYKKSMEDRIAVYNSYINRKRQEIEKMRDQERIQLEEIYHDLSRNIAAVRDFTSDLFDRKIEDEDFLQVYLGKEIV